MKKLGLLLILFVLVGCRGIFGGDDVGGEIVDEIRVGSTSSDDSQDSSQEPSDSSEDDSERFTVIEYVGMGGISAPDEALDIEEVAQIGADYIWDMLGERIDGMYMVLNYFFLPDSGRSGWSGFVFATRANADNHVNPNEIWALETSYLFNFQLDAITGERLALLDRSDRNHFRHLENSELGIGDYCFDYVLPEDWEEREVEPEMDVMTNEERLAWEECYSLASAEAFPALSSVEIEEAIEIVRNYAQRHFNSSTVVRAEVSSSVHWFNSIDFEGYAFLMFEAEDETGRVIIIFLQRDTNRFLELRT